MNAAFILFVNGIDEQVLLVLKKAFPDWVETMAIEVKTYAMRLDELDGRKILFGYSFPQMIGPRERRIIIDNHIAPNESRSMNSQENESSVDDNTTS